MAETPRRASVRASTPESTAASIKAISPAAAPRTTIPERYVIGEKDGTRFLECDEAPRLRAIIDPQMSVSRSGAASLGSRVILLDGAGSFGPLIDNDEKLYNLDHHAGCERLFTLSTCEQALLLVHSGLDLSEGDWKIYANDPDLDTVLALWCLLNYRRVRELSPDARDILLPLFRLEGAIDANGPDLARLCGLSNEHMERTQRRIDVLLARERELKQTGAWSKKKLYPYTLEMLRAVDALIYAREDFGDYTRVDAVYGHVELGPRQVAVVCRDSAGIYTVEQHLKTRWGDQLSLIALENEPGQYTLRRVSSVSGPKLGPAYERLNRIDRAVDGRPLGKQWGGSEDIGGSPRPSGTLLAADELLEVLERTYRPSTWWTRIRGTAGALFVGLLCLAAWPLADAIPPPASIAGLHGSSAASYTLAMASLLVFAVGLVVTRVASHRRTWVFGWRRAVNGGGWWLAPLALLGFVPLVVWTSTSLSVGARPSEVAAAFGAAALAIGAGEVWFRGLVHGLLVPDYPVQRPGGQWLVSRAALTSAIAYALVATVVITPAVGMPVLSGLGITPFEVVLGSLVVFFAVGLALGALRERTLSFLPGLALQWAGLGVAAIAAGVVLTRGF
jgi:hypothetical protein